MADKDPKKPDASSPDQQRLTERQVARLAKATGVAAEELRKGNIAELADRLKFRIERRCLGAIQLRLSVGDFRRRLGGMLHESPIRRGQNPPDPPLLRGDGGNTLRLAEEMLGRNTARRLATAESTIAFGRPTKE